MLAMQKDTNNPIAQDTTKNGTIRFLFYKEPWNYGLFPQTWEDPDKEDSDIRASVMHVSVVHMDTKGHQKQHFENAVWRFILLEKSYAVIVG